MNASKLLKSIMGALPGGQKLHQCFSLRNALSDIGWLRSNRERQSIDAKGNALPWITYGAIHFLQDRIPESASVLEFGCGNSTRWWSKRCNSIVAIEHDERWYKKIVEQLPSNASCILHTDATFRGEQNVVSQYCQAVGVPDRQYDILVIDGMERNNCAFQCLRRLGDSGVIIWDNSERAAYESGYEFLFNRGFRKVDFWGLAPIVNHFQCTSVFYRDGNILGI